MPELKLRSKDARAPSFKGLLQAELIERCRNNPNYSLRSFAKSLRVEPSALSQILRGKRPISLKMKLRLGSALGLSIEKLRNLPTSDEDANARTPRSKYQQQSFDEFALISDWYHYAILELTHVKGFSPDPLWIARKLGISRSEVNIALERLFRAGLLKETENGKWIDASEGGRLTHLSPAATSEAARAYQCQLLELSKKSVQEIPISLRNHTSATLCFDPADLPDAIERIREFRRSFAEEFQPKKKGSEVYQIQISFFPLTKSKDA